MSDQPTAAPQPDVLGYFSEAVKEKLKALVAIDGPTGSGKTWTALQAARILAGPDGTVALIDTENRTSLHYAAAPGAAIQRINFWDPPYRFKHMTWNPPYHPGNLSDLINALQDHVDVIVLDSMTHFWTGEGGTLDVVDDAASRASGNSFAGWKVGSPVQRHLLDVLIHARCHVIITMRSKMEWVIEQQVVRGQGGKERTINVPRKVGLAPEQRAGIEYEFNVVADMDLENKLVITKTRCDLLSGVVAQKGRSAEVWQTYAAWLDMGVAMPTERDVDEFVAEMNAITDAGVRKAVKVAVVETYGMPDRMTLETMVAAREWLATAVAAANAQPHSPDTPASAASAGPSEAKPAPEASDAPKASEPATEPEGPPPDPVETIAEQRAKEGIVAEAAERAAEAAKEAVARQSERIKAAKAEARQALDLTPEQAAQVGVTTRVYTGDELADMGTDQAMSEPVGEAPAGG